MPTCQWSIEEYEHQTSSDVCTDLCREALAAPVDDVLFFAGEATHPAVNPCMQAALETGERSAAQVLRAAERTLSRL